MKKKTQWRGDVVEQKTEVDATWIWASNSYNYPVGILKFSRKAVTLKEEWKYLFWLQQH